MICCVNTIVGYNKWRVKRPSSRRNLRRSRATSHPRAEAPENFRQCCRGKIRIEPVANQQFRNESVESDFGHVAADWRRFESGCWRDNQSGSEKDFAPQIARHLSFCKLMLLADFCEPFFPIAFMRERVGIRSPKFFHHFALRHKRTF